MNFGNHLREARERRGVSLRQIATSTRISLRTLEALENNEISKLPGGIFSRAFVRSYAHEVGLDPDETVREFVQYFPLDHVTAGTAAAAEGERLDGEDDLRRRRVLGLTLAAAIAVPLAVLVIYLLITARRPVTASAVTTDYTTSPGSADVTSPSSSATSPSPSSGSSPSNPSSSPATNGASTAAPAAGAAATPAGSATLTPLALAPTEPLRLRIAPDGACWIRVTADGGASHQQLLQKGEVYTADARSSFDLLVGDAGTFRFSLNDRAGRSLGASGDVVSARITRENVQSWLARTSAR